MRILTHSAELIGRIADKLLAQDCLLCGADSGKVMLCPACVDDLPRLPAVRCPQCALPTALGETCGRCLAKPPHYDATIAAFHYDFPLDKLVQSFKYAHRLALGSYFAREIATQAQGLKPDLLIPLPLHPLRLRERGFNQAQELARAVGKILGCPTSANICTRTRHTPAQAALPWRERAKNVRGAFHCNADLSGRHIALIDDVMTTGASLSECARTLKLHGAARVTLLVIARALPKP